MNIAGSNSFIGGDRELIEILNKTIGYMDLRLRIMEKRLNIKDSIIDTLKKRVEFSHKLKEAENS